jgi:hypothetical protein
MPFLSDTHCGVKSLRKSHRIEMQSKAHVMLQVLTNESMAPRVKMTEVHSERGNVFEISPWQYQHGIEGVGAGSEWCDLPRQQNGLWDEYFK